MDIFIPTKRTAVTSKRELRKSYCCENCGFQSVVRIVGEGTVYKPEQLAFTPSAVPTKDDIEAAQSKAIAEGNGLLAIVACRQCGKRNNKGWARYMRWTRAMQGGVVAIFAAIIKLMIIQAPENYAFGLIIAFPGAFAVFIVGYIRSLHADVPAKRVTFLSPEDLAAEAEQAAKEAAEEAREEAEHEEARRARAKGRRLRAVRAGRLES